MGSHLFVLITAILCVINVQYYYCSDVIEDNDDSTSNDSNDQYKKPLLNISNDFLSKTFLPYYLNIENDIINNSNITQQCRNDFDYTIKSFYSHKLWSYKLFNSWTRSLPSGLLMGTFTDYGDYDQCLSITNNLQKFLPQYCLLDLSLPVLKPMPKHHNIMKNHHQILIPSMMDNTTTLMNDTFAAEISKHSSLFYYLYVRMAICIPNTCTEDDIENVVHNLLTTNQLNGIELHSTKCQIKSTNRWLPNSAQKIALVLLFILISITIWSLIYDMIVSKKSNKLSEQILLWFSPLRNASKLLSINKINHNDLNCIHGMRFLTLVWIIIGHTLEWNSMNVFQQSFEMKNKLSSLLYQPLFKAHYSVDTFFYMSGLLTSYVTLEFTQNDYRKFRLLPYTLLRYVRLTPQLIAFMLLLSLLPSMFDGPLWPTYMEIVIDKCSITWWHNLLYLQNFIDLQNICAIHTWYLAADMQLHYMSIVLIVILLKYPKRGLISTKLVVLVCGSISALTIFLQKHPPGAVVTTKTDFLDENGRPSEFLHFFYQPWNHAIAFFIGFIFGCKLYERKSFKQNEHEMGTVKKYFYWSLVIIGYLFCIYSTVPWLHGQSYIPFWSAILYPLNLLIWSLILTAIIWLCITDNGLFIQQVLSWKIFRPLSRMSFSVYLTHALIVYVVIGTKRNLIDMHLPAIISMLMATIVMSYLFGFIFTILVESPVIQFLDYIKNYWLNQSNGMSMNNNTCYKHEIDKLKIESNNNSKQNEQFISENCADTNV